MLHERINHHWRRTVVIVADVRPARRGLATMTTTTPPNRRARRRRTRPPGPRRRRHHGTPGPLPLPNDSCGDADLWRDGDTAAARTRSVGPWPRASSARATSPTPRSSSRRSAARRRCRTTRCSGTSRSPAWHGRRLAVDEDLALECWQNNGCDTGTGGELTVGLADGFGGNVARQLFKMEFILQALTYPEIGEIVYTDANLDTQKAISDVRSMAAQGVDIIVSYPDAGEALLPAYRAASGAGLAGRAVGQRQHRRAGHRLPDVQRDRPVQPRAGVRRGAERGSCPTAGRSRSSAGRPATPSRRRGRSASERRSTPTSRSSPPPTPTGRGRERSRRRAGSSASTPTSTGGATTTATRSSASSAPTRPPACRSTSSRPSTPTTTRCCARGRRSATRTSRCITSSPCSPRAASP